MKSSIVSENIFLQKHAKQTSTTFHWSLNFFALKSIEKTTFHRMPRVEVFSTKDAVENNKVSSDHYEVFLLLLRRTHAKR